MILFVSFSPFFLFLFSSLLFLLRRILLDLLILDTNDLSVAFPYVWRLLQVSWVMVSRSFSPPTVDSALLPWSVV